MSSAAHPRVTVSLPVFNGERYLIQALDSILEQTFADFELIITDNASTDGTEDICRRYAARDERIRYHRNPTNIGVNKNFDLGLEMARGELFKWAAHDDLLAKDFLAECLARCEADPDTVLVQSLVGIINDAGERIAGYDSGLIGSDADLPATRFRALVLNRHICTEVFGLFRTEVLRRTPGLSHSFHGCDRVLLAEIALLGKIQQVPRELFFNREHNNRYVRAVKPSKRAAFHRASGSTRTELSHWMQFKDMRRAVREHVADREQRRRCARVLTKWWLVHKNALRVGVELSARIVPPVYDWTKWLNDRFLKPAHPTVHTERRASR